MAISPVKEQQVEVLESKAYREGSAKKIHGIELRDSHKLAAFVLTNMRLTVEQGCLVGESIALGEGTHEALRRSCRVLNHALDAALHMALPDHADNSNILCYYAVEEAIVKERRASCFFLSEEGVVCFRKEGSYDVGRDLPMQRMLKVINLREELHSDLTNSDAMRSILEKIERCTSGASERDVSNDDQRGRAR